ncbi:hypothetical protein MKX01_002227 [Papaver californicum]|nr:hypothetical protein MKX01_002227 [Papaver californicum]
MMKKSSRVQQHRHSVIYNQDLVTRIFTKLPVEKVLEVKGVCKSWRQFVKESSYVDDDECGGGKYGFIGITQDGTEDRKYYLSYIDYDYDDDIIKKKKVNHPGFFNFKPTLVGSRNGLVCIALPFCPEDLDEDCADPTYICDPIYICNPITKEYTLLPRFRSGEGINGGCINFGFAFHNGKYKVVRIFWEDREELGSSVGAIEMFTLGTEKWVSLGNTDCFFSASFPRGVYANGVLYWVSYGSERIMGLDLEDNQFHSILSPPFPVEVDLVQPLELNQKLCLIHEDDPEDGGGEIIIWMFDEMVWKKMFKFSSKDSDGNLLDLSPFIVNEDHEIFALIKNHQILYWHDKSLLNSYDILTDAEDTLFEDEEDINHCSIHHVHSLISLTKLQPNTLKFSEPIELQIAEVPSVTLLKKPFVVRLTITNHLNKDMGPFKIFLSRQDLQEEEAVMIHGAQNLGIRQVEAFSSMEINLNLIAARVGFQKIRGITLVDQDDNKTYNLVPDLEILVDSD